jgi:hypothetical protein
MIHPGSGFPPFRILDPGGQKQRITDLGFRLRKTGLRVTILVNLCDSPHPSSAITKDEICTVQLCAEVIWKICPLLFL